MSLSLCGAIENSPNPYNMDILHDSQSSWTHFHTLSYTFIHSMLEI